MSKWNTFLVSARRSLFSQAHTHRLFIERIMLEVADGGTILEAGCGLGFLSKLLADAGYDVTAGDLDEEVLASARATVQFTQNPIKYRKLDLFTLSRDMAGQRFDAIVHSGVMEHFSDEQIVASLREQKAVSKKLVFKIPNGRTKMNASHFGNERFMPNSHWIKLVREAGYQRVRVYGGESTPMWMHALPSILHLYPKHGQGSRRTEILTMLSGWRRHFSMHSIFVCE
jgi:cyclopropane fatty-acyl-phospholipid synthase-like methyltransferase